MQRQPNQIDMLTAQVRQGNVVARERLRRLLLPGLALIVRRTLQTGSARSALARQIFHEYRRVASLVPFPDAKIPASLVEVVARRLTDEMVEGLERRSGEANPLTERLMMSRETVVA